MSEPKASGHPQTLASTVSRLESRREEDAVPAAALVLVLQSDRPQSGSSWHSLAGVDAVVMGRASQRRAARTGGRLDLGVPDARVSQPHARIQVDAQGRWVVEDAGSKNGTLVNGARSARTVLEDGDLVEIGHTLFQFRVAVPPGGAGAPLDLDAGSLPEHLPGLRTFSPTFDAALANLGEVAGSGVSLLLLGESGTGKEVCARAIHARAQRPGAFVPVNCGALPASLIESELFGYRKGAFSGASDDRSGLVRSAHQGTLFLDEIADLPLPSQAALLRVLQEREVTPVGATQPVPVDIQVIAATHRDLAPLVRRELFRHDLYARVAGYAARLPALRERREDIGLLIASLLARIPDGAGARFTSDAARAIVRRDWPLNVRELESCLTVAVRLARGSPVETQHLPRTAVDAGEHREESSEADQLSPRDRKRRARLVELLREHGGNVSAVARAGSWNRVQVHRWLARYGLDARRFRE